MVWYCGLDPVRLVRKRHRVNVREHRLRASPVNRMCGGRERKRRRDDFAGDHVKQSARGW